MTKMFNLELFRLQNYIKNLNYQTFYQKNNEKSFFLSQINQNQAKNDKLRIKRELVFPFHLIYIYSITAFQVSIDDEF